MPRPRTVYTWDTKSARYRRADNGFFIRRRDIDRLFMEFITGGQRRAAALANSLLARDLAVAEWQAALRDELRHAHTVAAVTARGGWAQMTAADWGRLGARTRGEYARLNNFAAEVTSGAQKFNGTIRSRSGRYIRGARSTYYNEQHRLLIERQAGLSGVLLARRVYGFSVTGEKCDGCQREHDRGWQAADTIAEIGSQECGHNCNCYLLYKLTGSLTEAQVLIGTQDDGGE